MNLLDAEVRAADRTGATLRLPGGLVTQVPVVANGLTAGEQVTFGLRPEHLRLVDAGPIRGEVVIIEQLGSLTILHVEVAPGVVLVVQSEGGLRMALHTPVSLAFDPAAGHVFRSDGRALAPAPVLATEGATRA